MMTQTMNAPSSLTRSRHSAEKTIARPNVGLLRRLYKAWQMRREDRNHIRALEKLDDMILRDVTGLSRAQLEVAFRLPESIARREIARHMSRR
ncbi:hypothetical protein [Thalassospira sp. TSL5-1]|uniref:hypothetical protein n=1 Tax=Thalassospira sp. TSL5-1 TaxID=1544451 RepID=UPI0009406135|nr:hypothetical protein [Thalassospira sp. TSL5-1]OKH86941.1 hypothetical protein LF95_18185 [Thalassospira sp. TSL5-1]